MRRINKTTLAIAAIIATIIFIACNDMKVGYLDSNNASFSPDTVFVYRNIDPTSDRAIYNAPWQSSRIQGVSGTAPVNYAFASVKVSDGGDEAAFIEAVNKGQVVIQGGVIQLFQDGVKILPNGKYTLSIKVYNEGYENILTDIFTFVVADDDPDMINSDEDFVDPSEEETDSISSDETEDVSDTPSEEETDSISSGETEDVSDVE